MRWLVEFRCLGPLAVVVDGRELDLGSRKQRLVVAHLLIHLNATVSTDRLIEEIWQGAPPASVRNSLHSYVSRLRRALGPDRIESYGAGYLLRADPEAVDRNRFEALVAEGRRLRHEDPETAGERLQAALELWAGTPFADLAHEPGLRNEIDRLEELRLSAVEERVAADLDCGAGAALVPELETLTTHHPLREQLWAHLMLALYRAGRQSDALAAYGRLRTVLAEELGIDPSASLRSLHQRILRQDPLLQPDRHTVRGYALVDQVSDDLQWEVWRARPPGGSGQVIIKAACRELANAPVFVRGFDARAQQIADLQHPHVLPLYDFWREPDGAYLVYRSVGSGDLRRLLLRPADTALPDRLRIADEVLQALAWAHGRRVVHGRLRPSSVLLDPGGHAYLTNFAMGGEHADTATMGAGQGPAPDRLGDGITDARSDVRAVGTLLSELLPDLNGGAQEVLRRAMAGDSSERQHDAAALHRQFCVALRAAGVAPATGATGTDTGGGSPRNPYKGLRAFRESDADDFCGRESFVDRLLERMREDSSAARFLAIVGPSGSGKSSVVRAGLLPALRLGALPSSESWYVTTVQPGRRPFAELATALRRVAVDAPNALADRIASAGLSQTLVDVLPDDGELLLVIDQFEELFTLTDHDERRRFIDVVVAAVNDPPARLRVVVTIRADFYDRPLQHRQLGRLLQLRTETLAPMSPAELTSAVTVPAEHVGARVEPSLVAEMVADTADEAAALPLLQYALTQLFDACANGRLSTAAYRRIGGVAGALGRQADEVFTNLTDGEQAAARQLFLRLVTPGRSHADGYTRRRVSSTEIIALAPEEMPRVLSAFGDARLLSFDRDSDTREPTVEVAHEALLVAWDRLRVWIETARDDLHTQHRLAAAADDWVAADREPSFLATGSQLAQYERWRGQAMTPTTGEAAYLDASLVHREHMAAAETKRRAREAATEARANRRLRVLVGVLAVAAVAGGILTVIAVTQADRAADRAQVANARELAAAAMSSLEADAERSLLLALEAVDVSRSAGGEVLPEAAEALHAAITASRVHLRVPSHSGLVDWHPEGTRFVMEGAQAGHVEVRDAATGELVASWVSHDGPLGDLAYAPDGSVVATGNDGHLAVWNQSQELRADLSRGDGPVTGVSTSADGGLLAAAWPLEDVVRVFEVRTGELVQEIAAEGPTATSFARDGNWLAIGRRFGHDLYSSLDDEATRALVGRASWTGEPSFRAPAPVGEGDQRWKLIDRGPGWTPEVAFGQDGGYLMLAGEEAIMERLGPIDRSVWFQNSPGATGLAVGATANGVLQGVTTLDWPDNTPFLVTASRDGFVQVWTVDGTAVELTTTISSADTVAGLNAVALDADGQRLLAGSAGSRSVVMWDLSLSGTAHLTNMPVRRGASGATAVGGGRVLMPGVDDLAAVRDSRSGRVIDHVGPGQVPDRLVAADPAGQLVAGIVSSSRVSVYAAGTDEPLWVLAQWGTPRRSLTAVGVSAQPHRVLVQDETGAVRVYDRAGEQVAELGDPAGFGGNLAVSGGRMAVAQDVGGVPAVTVWDVSTIAELARFEGVATAVDLSEDGTLLAMTGDRAVTIGDVASGETLAELPQPSGVVAAVAISHGGRQVVTGSADGLVRLFDVASGEAPVVLRGHEAPVTTVAWVSETVVMSGDSEGLFRSWETDLDVAVDIARNELARGFTDEECRQYLRLDRCPASGS